MAGVRRILSACGLGAILWIGVLLVQGDLSVADAGIRAMLALVAVVVLVRIVESSLAAMASSLERQAR